jgi:hypothetical protein
LIIISKNAFLFELPAGSFTFIVLYINDNTIKSTNEFTSQIVQPYIDWDKHEKPELYYNNLIKEGKTEIMNEYIVNIDSIDRDINRYPNPFNYKVYFKSIPNQTGAVINRNFKNVKYLDLQSMILPRKFYINKDILDINTIDNNINSLFNPNTKSGDLFILSDKEYLVIDYYNNDIKTLVYMLKPNNNFISINECWEISKNSSNFIYYHHFFLDNYSLEQEKFLLLYIDEITDNKKLSSNYNIEKAFDLILTSMIDTKMSYYHMSQISIVLFDNHNHRTSDFQKTIVDLFRNKGILYTPRKIPLPMPHILFWNIAETFSSFPFQYNMMNTFFISGLSVASFEQLYLLSNRQSAFQVISHILGNRRYDLLENYIHQIRK